MDMIAVLATVVVGLVTIAAYRYWPRVNRQRQSIRRTHTVAYTYSATATSQPHRPTYLAFPASPLAARIQNVRPTVLRDFTSEVAGLR